MSKALFKYKLTNCMMLPGEHKVLKPGSIELPEDSSVLSVGAQGADAVIWALVTDRRYLQAKKIILMATGCVLIGAAAAELDANYSFLGTIQFDNGLVFHCFIGN